MQRIMDCDVVSDCLGTRQLRAAISCTERKFGKRDGLTLVDVLVSLAIIGVLLAITVPAVQASRSAFHRLKCSNHQRQLLLATSNYHDTYHVFPPMSVISTMSDCPSDWVMSRLFPYLGLTDFCEMANSTVTRIPVLECPADSGLADVPRPLSYVFNASAGSGSGSLLRGPFSDLFTSFVGARDITDGLSMTAGLSENIALRAGGSEAEARKTPMRYAGAVIVPSMSASALVNQSTREALMERAAQTDLSLQDCLEGPRLFAPVPTESTLGQWIAGFGGGPWTYSHWYPPNSPTCGAYGNGRDTGVFLQSFNRRAASSHSGGLNVGFLDGHVQFYSTSVDRIVWRAVGTHNGNEAATGGGE